MSDTLESIEELLGIESVDPNPKSTRPIRLSVSALRDYRRCPRYYKYKRIDKKEAPAAHYLAAGNAVHNSFYAAFSTWDPGLEEIIPAQELMRDPDAAVIRAELVFEYMWERDKKTLDAAVAAGIPREQLDEFADGTPLIENFTFGSLKALKEPNYGKRAANWKEHYRKMLKDSLHEFMGMVLEEEAEIVSIEDRVTFELGGVNMLGFIDITMKLGNGKLVLVDLKTGMNKPNAGGLELEDQMQSYFAATEADEVWLYHMRSSSFFQLKRNKKFIKSLHEMAEQDAHSIQAGFFPKRFDKDQCGRCEFRKDCHG